MRNPTEVLKNLMEKSKNETYRFQRLYRNLYNPEFYWLAYKNIYATIIVSVVSIIVLVIGAVVYKNTR